MQVRIADKRFKVEFSYTRQGGYMRAQCGLISRAAYKGIIRETICYISRPGTKRGEWAIVAMGQSYRANEDNPCKTTGRRVAFSKALASVWPPTKVEYDSKSGLRVKVAPKHNRDIRTKFWKAYFKQVEKTNA